MAGQSFELERFGLDDMAACSAALRAFASSSSSAEEAAQKVADHLYRHLVDAGGSPACALVRTYRTHPYALLPPALQEYASGGVGPAPRDDTRCLTLLGTAGDLPEWYARELSVGHKTIPLVDEATIERLPMVRGLITQLGIDTRDVVAPRRERIVELAQRTYDVFHVADAVGSPHVPDQEFVARHGIRSAVGFGGVLLGGEFYAVLLFSKVPIERGVAATLKILSLAVRVALLPFDARRTFAAAPEGRSRLFA